MHIFVCRKCDKIVHAAGADAPRCCYCGGATVEYDPPEATRRPRIVYICAPEKMDVREICKTAALRGFTPIAPSLYHNQFLDGRHPWEYRVSQEMDRALLEFCDTVYCVGNDITPTMQSLIAIARLRRIPIVLIAE